MGPKLLREIEFCFVIFQNGVVLANSNRTAKIVGECVKDLSISKVTSKFDYFGLKRFFEVSTLPAVSHYPKLQS